MIRTNDWSRSLNSLCLQHGAVRKALLSALLLVACTEASGTDSSNATVGDAADARAPSTSVGADSGNPVDMPTRDASTGSDPRDASVEPVDASPPVTDEPFEELPVIALDSLCGDAYQDVLFPNGVFGKVFRWIGDEQEAQEEWFHFPDEAMETSLQPWTIDWDTHRVLSAFWGSGDCAHTVAVTAAREYADRVEVEVTFDNVCLDGDIYSVRAAAAALPRRDKEFRIVVREKWCDRDVQE